MQEFKGKLIGDNIRVGIVISRFNELITRSLLTGALECLEQHNVPTSQITVAWVPGAYEIPLIAKQLATTGQFDAIICLGAVIKGATPHFDYVAGHAASGIAQASLETNLPIVFGVLTTDTIEQALERAGTKAGNKGCDAAQTAIEMVNLQKQIRNAGYESQSNQDLLSELLK